MKLFKMKEADGAYKHGRYETVWLNSVYEMFIVNDFAMQDGQPAKYKSLHRSI